MTGMKPAKKRQSSRTWGPRAMRNPRAGAERYDPSINALKTGKGNQEGEAQSQSSIDHGLLNGLGDDDHPQYLKSAGDTMTGHLIFNDEFRIVPSSPSQLTANVDDYAIGEFGSLRLSSDASRNITGMVAQGAGHYLILVNVGSNDIVLMHQDTNSAAANRIICNAAGTDITLNANDVAVLIYDGTTQRWRVLSTN